MREKLISVVTLKDGFEAENMQLRTQLQFQEGLELSQGNKTRQIQDHFNQLQQQCIKAK